MGLGGNTGIDSNAGLCAAILSCLDEGVIVVDAQGRFEHCNDSASRILGLTAGQIAGRDPLPPGWQLIGDDGSVVGVGDFTATVLQLAQTACEVTLGIHRSPSELTWISITARPVLQGGSPLSSVVVLRSLPPESGALVASEIEARYHALFDGSSECVFLADLNGNFLDCNAVSLDLLGYSREDIPNLSFQHLLSGDSLRSAMELMGEIRQTGRQSQPAEYCLRARDGREVTVEARSVLISRDGKPYRILGIARDITERKRAQEQLAAINTRLNLALASADVGIWEWDVPSGVVVWDDRAREIYGALPGQSSATHEIWRNRLHPEDRSRVTADVEAALRGERKYESEFRIVHPDGAVKWVKSYGVVVRGPDGQPLRMIGLNRDITVQHSLEDSLRESEFWLRESQRVSHIGSYVMDITADRWHSSAELDAIFGIGPDFPRTALGWGQVVHPDDQESMLEYFRNDVVGHEHPFDRQYRIVRQNDGAVRWVHGRGAVIRETNSARLVMTGTIQDITPQKEAELALRASDIRYHALFEQAGDGVFLMDTHGTILSANRSFATLHGYSVEELCNVSLDRINPTGLALIEQQQQRFANGEILRFEAEHFHRDGHIIHLAITANLITIGEERFILATHQDVSERKRAEQALRDTESRWRAIFEHSRDAIGVSSQGINQFENSAFRRLFGYSDEDQLAGRSIFDFWSPDSHPALEELIRTHSDDSVELRGRRKDGTEFDAELTRSAYRANGVEYSLAVIRDLTERKRAARERERLQEELAQAQKMESVGRLAGGIAHDFNNLLTVINGYSELAMREYPVGDPNRRRLEQVHKAGTRAADLTRQLLAFSRKQAIDLKPLDLNLLLGNHLDLFNRVVGEDVILTADLAPGLSPILADKGQLVQVLMNLIVNARDAMPEGGHVRVSTSAGNDEVVLRISDTGSGMDEATRQHIFEPFFTTKPEGQGTGLGLSTVYGIVKQLGGWINVETALGRGTTFILGFPATPDSFRAESASAAETGSSRGNETILVVEDQDEVRDFTASVLAAAGYRIITAGSGEEAAVLVQNLQEPLHLVLTDVVMTGMTGRELASQIRALRGEIPVLFMSGYARDVLTSHNPPDPGTHYIQKPFSAAELTARIGGVLAAGRVKRRVIVADDESEIRKLFSTVLLGAGYEVAEAEDGNAVERLLNTGHFDVLVTDLVMPDREGLETIQLARGRYPELKIIAVSGALGGGFLKVARKFGADVALLKPVAPTSLLDVVASLLRN